MGLAFHQTKCVHYKVICIRSLEPARNLLQIQLYSSDTRKWKISIESFSARNPVFCKGKGVYWNGALHWAPYCGNHLYFNIEAEQLQMLPLPVQILPSEIWKTYFGESRGHLHLIVSNKREDNSLCLNVYEMVSDHSGWFVKYQLQFDELPDPFPERSYHLFVVDVIRGEKEEDTFLALILFGSTNDFQPHPPKLITYNVHAKSLKYIESLSLGSQEYFRYIETLSSF